MLRKHACRKIQVGYAPTCGVAYPATDKKEDIEAARAVYFSQNNLFPAAPAEVPNGTLSDMA